MSISEQMKNDTSLQDFFLLVAQMKTDKRISLVEYRILMEGSRFGEKSASRALSLVKALSEVFNSGFDVVQKPVGLKGEGAGT